MSSSSESRRSLRNWLRDRAIQWLRQKRDQNAAVLACEHAPAHRCATCVERPLKGSHFAFGVVAAILVFFSPLEAGWFDNDWGWHD